jgi:hypothetical protein
MLGKPGFPETGSGSMCGIDTVTAKFGLEQLERRCTGCGDRLPGFRAPREADDANVLRVDQERGAAVGAFAEDVDYALPLTGGFGKDLAEKKVDLRCVSGQFNYSRDAGSKGGRQRSHR